MSEAPTMLLALFLLIGNAFFVGAEFALIAARRTQIEPIAVAGSRRAKITLDAMEHISLMMACAQLGITVCSLGLGATAEPAIAHLIETPMHAVGMPDQLLHPIAFVIAMTLVVFLHMVLGEMVPKNIALATPEKAALALAPPLATIAKLIRPLIRLLNGAANLFLRACRVQPVDELASTYTSDQVAALVEESHREGLIDQSEHDLINGAFTLGNETVSSVALPLDSLVTVRPGITSAEIERICAETGYSRFPVVDTDNQPVGYLHLKDVLELESGKRDRVIAKKWHRPLANVSASSPLRSALEVMRAKGAHIARVVDDDGTTIGVATLEDVLERMVGEVIDATQRQNQQPPE